MGLEIGTISLSRVVVAIDPTTSNNPEHDETGIIVAGSIGRGEHKTAYVLDDLSGFMPPDLWGQVAVDAYRKYMADLIVGEVNQGGDMVENVIKTVDRRANFKAVRATRGKFTRAEPIAALYAQGKVFHVRQFKQLEDQMCSYIPGVKSKSPDRMDAMVWALTELMLEDERKEVDCFVRRPIRGLF